MPAGFDRLHGDEVANTQVFDAVADIDDSAAQLVAENDGVLDARQRMRSSSPRGDRPFVIFMQVATADAVVEHLQLDLPGAGHRLRDVFQSKILPPMKNGCAHYAIVL